MYYKIQLEKWFKFESEGWVIWLAKQLDLVYKLRRVLWLVTNVGFWFICLMLRRRYFPLKVRIMYYYSEFGDMDQNWKLGLGSLLIKFFDFVIQTGEVPLISYKL